MKNFKYKELLIKYFIQGIFWIGLWELISRMIGSSIILPSPFAVFQQGISMVFDEFFWLLLFKTLINILVGLTIGVIFGAIFAILAFFFKMIKWIIDPFVNLIKTTPVAALIILLLVWIKSANIAWVLVSFVVFPNIYLNISEELQQADIKIIEVFEVFRVSKFKRFRFFYLPISLNSIYKSLPFIIGFAWKSGISGEIISQAKNTLGNEIYISKVYLEIDTLFAYVFLLIIIASLFEKFVLYVIRRSKWII